MPRGMGLPMTSSVSLNLGSPLGPGEPLGQELDRNLPEHLEPVILLSWIRFFTHRNCEIINAFALSHQV